MRFRISLLMATFALIAVVPTAWAGAETAEKSEPIKITVTVRNPRGAPVAGAAVEVRLAPPSAEEGAEAPAPVKARTDAMGRAAVKLSRAGLARVAVTAPTYLATVMAGVTLESGAKIPVQLERGGTLKGKVIDAQGRVYGGISVLVLKAQDDDVGPRKLAEPRPPVKTRPDGSFVVENLSSGFYTAFLMGEPGKAPVVELAGGAPPRAHVTEDAEAEMEVLVKPLGRIEGAVEFPSADVPETVLVTPVPAVAEHFNEGYVARHQITVPTNGRVRVLYALAGLTSGDYRVEFEAKGYAPLLSSDDMFLPTGGRVVFADQFMDEGVETVGRLRRAGDDDSPVGDADVLLFFPGLEVPLLKATSGKDGSFRFGRLLPGKYVVRARVRGLLDVDETVKVRPGTKKAHLDIEVQPGAVVEGVVTEHGKPEAGVEIMLQRLVDEKDKAQGRAGGFSRMRSDGQGRFRFRGMPAGRYTLLAPSLGVMQEFSLRENEQRTVAFEVDNAPRLRSSF